MKNMWASLFFILKPSLVVLIVTFFSDIANNKPSRNWRSFPASTISSGDVCRYYTSTGIKVINYVLGDSAIFVNGCNPAALSLSGASLVDILVDALGIQQATSPRGALALVKGELGGRAILPGAYKTDSSYTVAAGQVVTLQGNAEFKFIFLAGASVTTGAGTTFNLVPDEEDEEGPQAKNIYGTNLKFTKLWTGRN
jgi:hypothetical protein